MKSLISKLLTHSAVLLLMSSSALAIESNSQSYIESFAQETTNNQFYAENSNKTLYRFMVSFKDENLSMSLVNNEELRRKNSGSGVSFSYKGQVHTRDINDFKTDQSFKSEIKRLFGYEVQFHSFFNDIHIITVATTDRAPLNKVADNLFSTGYFNYVEEDQYITLQSKGDEGDVGGMSVLNPSSFNDPVYPEQIHFAKQSSGYYGAASIEAAIDLMSRHGVFNTNDKVNVHVIDSGFIEHEDVQYAEYMDIKYTYDYDEGDDGVIWLNGSQDPSRPDYAIYESCSNRSNNGYGYLQNEPTAEQAAEYDWIRYETDGTAIKSSHGLNAASIIGATSNNNIGIAGIIPQDNVNLVSALAVDDCGGYSSFNLMAMYWSIGELELPAFYSAGFNETLTPKTQYPADVINMSFGSEGWYCSVDQSGSTGALAEFAKMASDRGVVLIVSAGNSRYHMSDGSVAGCPYFVSVGAVTEWGNPTNFTNYGTGIDLMALGSSVRAATATKTLEALETDYSGVSGTSFSGPIVAGLAGLIKLYDKTLTGEEVRNIMKSGARDLTVGANGGDTSCAVIGCGAGAVNFENTMRILLGGEILTQPKASHYLANNLSREDSSFLSKAQEFNKNMCTTYRMDGYLLNDRFADIRYRFYGSNDGEKYELINSYNKGSFLFDNTYAYYRLRGCNTAEGVCSDIRDVEIDDSFTPGICI
ncbi:S8 family serine peptidase [Pseudidiomarina halophila]|uniref:Peptidase S8/S53 domain-containing protein n=1 Tax=Pseudidiomarina halophila TaxID=1449799 RepID=A0A432XZW1_9GAMM|nr:S8 family serine peptidase [Pseudidiomarina halophila]RUO54243.1 hypothetical protein CWI69_02130 [Pseudidiomarina halophila]